MIGRVIVFPPLGSSLGAWAVVGFPNITAKALSQIGLKEVETRRHRDGFSAPAHAQLAIDTAYLGLYRIGGRRSEPRPSQHTSVRRLDVCGPVKVLAEA